MTRNLKVLGLALVAALAMSVVAASAASAQGFHAEDAHTILKGTQATENVFTTAAGTVTCKTATFEGTTESTTPATITITPNYSNCTAFGETVNVDVHENNCHYTFSITGTVPNAHGGTDISCPGNPIEVTAPLCRITVDDQTGVGTVDYSNRNVSNPVVNATREVVVTATVTNIKYTQHGIFCPGNGFSATKSFTTGTYTGSVNVTGQNTAGTEHKGVWVT